MHVPDRPESAEDNEHLPATFIYAGIDVERSGLFTGVRGQQIAGRSQLINTRPFPCNTEWKQLIGGMETTLRLHRHHDGSLVSAAKYLHQRAGGMIGSLGHLIRASAIRAVLDGSEEITQSLMDKVRVDHAVESATRRGSSTHQ